MFRGTMMKKTQAAGVTMALSLDELDRPNHCPENIEEESWKHLCELRRKKIQSEEKIHTLDNEIYETDQSVCERAANAKRLEHAVEQAIANLETWRKDKNYKLNNTEILLAVTKGQLEVETQKMSPYLPGATLISESMITSLNQDIQRLGESKLSAMDLVAMNSGFAMSPSTSNSRLCLLRCFLNCFRFSSASSSPSTAGSPPSSVKLLFKISTCQRALSVIFRLYVQARFVNGCNFL